MSPYRRNLLVGITVLGALITLGWMILKFGHRPARLFATPSMPVTFMTDRADGLGEGSNITYRGVIVGKVNIVRRTEDGKEVVIDAQLDRAPPLPANMFGEITMVSALGGTSTLVLQITGPEQTGQLQSGATLKAHFVGLQFLPPEFADLARELRATAQQFRESQVVLHLDEQVKKAGDVLDSANKLIGDPKLREDVKAAMTNIRQASETINRIGGKPAQLSDDASPTMGDVGATGQQIGGNVGSLSKQMGNRLPQISQTLDHFQSIAPKIHKRPGPPRHIRHQPQ